MIPKRPHRKHEVTVLLVIASVALLLAGVFGGALLYRVLDDMGPDGRGSDGRRTTVEFVPPAASTEGDVADRPIIVADSEQMSDAFKSAAARVRNAVVFIQVVVDADTEGIESWYDHLGDRFFRDHFSRRSVGSGVLLTHDGYIVTNHHVVDGAREITVTLEDKRTFAAEIVGEDRTTDLAVIKVKDESDLPTAIVANSDEVEVGEWVLAVGNPFRLTSTVTAGIVSALSRDVNIINSGTGIEDFIQTDAAINPGNSGGALVNLNGHLIGINTAIATESGTNEGYGFAVPTNLVKRVVADLIEYGEVQRGYLGVSVQEVDDRGARRYGLDEVKGVVLASVVPGGAADRAGINKGDVLLSINERDINAPNELQSVIARQRPGDLIRVRYWRNDRELETGVRLLGREDATTRSWLAAQEPPPERFHRQTPDVAPDTPSDLVAEWGITLRKLGRRDRADFKTEWGLYIEAVVPEQAAALPGIPRDAVLQAVNGQRVYTADDVREHLDERTGASVLSVLRRDGTVFFYELSMLLDD